MFRNNKKNKTKFYNTLFLLLIISITIGYAYLNTVLDIDGTSVISGNTWDIHFENIKVITNNNVEETTAPNIDSSGNVKYEILLKEQGSLYEFTVDVVNSGTLNAMLTSIENTGLTEEQSKLIEYSITYSDGSTIRVDDSLSVGQIDTYKITIKYKDGLTDAEMPIDPVTVNLTFSATYTQDNGNSIARKKSFTKLLESNNGDDSKLSFSSISSDTNGKGLYLLSSTKNDTNPIYYWRGAVTDNNMLFAGYCWKMVRTTDTGGLKLIYNGLPSDEGTCDNTGSASTIGTSKFNSSSNSPAYVGLMYGTVYSLQSKDLSKQLSDGLEIVYGKSVTWDENEGKYTLNDTITSTDYSTDRTSTSLNLNLYHYTCLDSSTSCTKVAYVQSTNETSAIWYITLTDGKTPKDALNEMFPDDNDSRNKTKSTILTYLETWYKTSNFITEGYSQYLEDDAIWCNDRTIYSYGGWDETASNRGNWLYFSAYGRRSNTKKPSLECSNENDAFTTANASRGNQKLTYPVGLLTADEIMLAGGQTSNNKSYYLYTGAWYWSLSPSYVNSSIAYGFGVYSDGYLVDSSSVSGAGGVRPSVSLKPGFTVSGLGTVEDPYRVSY